MKIGRKEVAIMCQSGKSLRQIMRVSIIGMSVLLFGSFQWKPDLHAAALGDISGDGAVTISDALLSLRYIVGLVPHTPANNTNYLAVCDVSPLDPITRLPKGNGVVDISDALGLLRYVVRLDTWGEKVLTPLPVSETVPTGGGIATTVAASYVALAWNDLGMHCLNPSYDTAVILPPYNTLRVQVIKRGNPPQVITTGLSVSYRLINNTTSQKGLFSQFWQYASQLFKASPAIDKGLNLDDPTVSNGLTGTMLAKGDHFQASGIPVIPISDDNSWNPFQLAEITVRDGNGITVAVTRATVPTSDEINCVKCHGNSLDPAVVFNDILNRHDTLSGTALKSQKPVLCASCHGSPALGATSAGSSGIFLSQAIHGFHANLATPPNCYDCHPGAVTHCSRSNRHTATDGNCTTCHGNLSQVASTIAGGSRIPWVNEPKCVTCHNTGINGNGVSEVDTGATLYRNATGHGGVYCSGCHGSPHAMTPSDQISDNYQPLQYQGVARSIGDCVVCHKTSRGGGNNFTEEHNTSGNSTACNVCHTGFVNAADASLWPHQFQWKSR